ncbi:MAG: TonB-dependent receptor, partial [Paludibacteraceae bacterium]|nr:TonB-dependent receptor [Paludibacteraceae bacterium]
MDNPNRVVKKGDIFGYNYHIFMFNAAAFLQNEWKFSKVDLYYALKATYNSFYRLGLMENGRADYLARVYALNMTGVAYDDAHDYYKQIYSSKGKGLTHRFLDPSAKAGITYHINGRNTLKANVLAERRAPYSRNAYISVRNHDRTIDDLKSQKVLSYDLSYEWNYPIFRGRITGFRTHQLGVTELSGYYDDSYNTFVNYAMTDLDQINQGVELGASVKLGTYFTLAGALSLSDHHYTSDAFAVVSAENGMALSYDAAGEPVYEVLDSVYTKGLKVASGPQLAGSLKLSFFHPKMWFADVTVSYFDRNYLDFAPSHLMKGMYTGVHADGTSSDVHYTLAKNDDGTTAYDQYGHPVVAAPYNQLSDQESLVDAHWYNRLLVDLSVGKLIYLPQRRSLSINLSVSNLLNNTHMKTGGYQQGRIASLSEQGQYKGSGTNRRQLKRISPNVYKYPAKYYYAWGANFFLSLTYKF